MSDVVELTGDFYPEICPTLTVSFIFYVKLPLGFRSTDQNQSERLIEEVAINQFFR